MCGQGSPARGQGHAWDGGGVLEGVKEGGEQGTPPRIALSPPYTHTSPAADSPASGSARGARVWREPRAGPARAISVRAGITEVRGTGGRLPGPRGVEGGAPAWLLPGARDRAVPQSAQEGWGKAGRLSQAV